MNRYRCSSCGTEFEADSSAPTVTLSCGGLPVECHRIGAPPEVAERVRIRRELLAEIESLTHYVEWRENRSMAVDEPWVGAADLRAALDRICPPEEGA